LYAPLPEKQKRHYVVNKCFTLVWNTAAGKKWEASNVIIHCTCFHGHFLDVSELIMCDRMKCGRTIFREKYV